MCFDVAKTWKLKKSLAMEKRDAERYAKFVNDLKSDFRGDTVPSVDIYDEDFGDGRGESVELLPENWPWFSVSKIPREK